jgi:signal transduction histidine kinase
VLRIVVSDDGRGIVAEGIAPREAGEGGYGLYSVRERLGLWDGALTIDSDESGTRATVQVPLAPPAHVRPAGVEAASAVKARDFPEVGE